MALGFGQLAKLMKGGLDPDQLAEMLGAMGRALAQPLRARQLRLGQRG